MSAQERLFEEYLAYHCAPALKGLKTANMFHVVRTSFPCAGELVSEYNEKFKDKDLVFRLFQAGRPRITFYVYSTENLARVLEQPEIRTFLLSMGYPVDSPCACLDHLEKRMDETSYPHEIGIFLGYPLDDVLGFISKKPCLSMGYWKVYDRCRVEPCKTLFTLFDRVRDRFIEAVENGCPIEQLI